MGYVREIYRPRNDTLTDQQRRFVDALISGGEVVAAAREAGYSTVFGNDTISRLVEQPRVAMAIRLGTMQRLHFGAPVALKLLEKLISDDEVYGIKPGLKLRKEAADSWLNRAGYVAPKAADAESGGSDQLLSELSPKALEALIGRLEQEKGDRARPVTIEASLDTDLDDMLG